MNIPLPHEVKGWNGGGSPSDSDKEFCDEECIITRWKNRYLTTTNTLTRTITDISTQQSTVTHTATDVEIQEHTRTKTKKEFIVETETRFHTVTATVTICDRWHRNCKPKVVTTTETEFYPTTIFCGYDCPGRVKSIARPVRVIKTIVDYDVITVESMCTKALTETEYRQIPVPCRQRPCPYEPEIITVTDFIPRKLPYPCIVTKEVTITRRPVEVCTYTTTSTRYNFLDRSDAQCVLKKDCGPKTVTETIVETVTRPCVKKFTVPTTIVQPVIKPVPVKVPVKCTVTERETVTETVMCRAKPCSPETTTKILIHTRLKPCVVKETDVVTKKVPFGVPKPYPVIETVAVPVPKPFPVKCTYTTTETEIRAFPVTCTKYPCPRTKTTTVTDYLHPNSRQALHSKGNAGVHKSQTRASHCREGEICYENSGIPRYQKVSGHCQRRGVRHQN